jgi:hypothetical protein
MVRGELSPIAIFIRGVEGDVVGEVSASGERKVRPAASGDYVIPTIGYDRSFRPHSDRLQVSHAFNAIYIGIPTLGETEESLGEISDGAAQ